MHTGATWHCPSSQECTLDCACVDRCTLTRKRMHLWHKKFMKPACQHILKNRLFFKSTHFYWIFSYYTTKEKHLWHSHYITPPNIFAMKKRRKKKKNRLYFHFKNIFLSDQKLVLLNTHCNNTQKLALSMSHAYHILYYIQAHICIAK